MTYEEQCKMLEDNYNLIFYVLRRNYPTFANNEDVRQIGAIGLWKACTTFDESKGYAFSSYACKCIHMTLREYITTELNKKLDTVDISEYAMQEDTVRSFIFEKPVEDLLTKRQLDILKLTMDGKSCRDIGESVGVSRTIVSQEQRKISAILKDNIIYI